MLSTFITFIVLSPAINSSPCVVAAGPRPLMHQKVKDISQLYEIKTFEIQDLIFYPYLPARVVGSEFLTPEKIRWTASLVSACCLHVQFLLVLLLSDFCCVHSETPTGPISLRSASSSSLCAHTDATQLQEKKQTLPHQFHAGRQLVLLFYFVFFITFGFATANKSFYRRLIIWE